MLPEQQSPFRLPRATPPGDDDHTHLWQDSFVDYLFGAPERIAILSIIVAKTSFIVLTMSPGDKLTWEC